MPDATVIAARRYAERHPGYQLVQAVEAAVPMAILNVSMLIQERKELPLIEEFVLRLCDQGITKIPEMAALLGIGDDSITEAVAIQHAAYNVDYRPGRAGEGRVVTLTGSGRQAVIDSVAVTPRRTTQPWVFDRLAWKPTSTLMSSLVSRKDATKAGMIILPSVRTHDVTPDDISPRSLNTVIDSSHHTGGEPEIQVLTVDAITKQTRKFLPVVLLIFQAAAFEDVRYSIVIDDLVSEAHDVGLADAGTERLAISIESPTGEPDLPATLKAQRVPHDTVLALQRLAGAREITGREEKTEDVLGDAAAARAELDSLAVRSVPAFEHRELLEDGMRSARSRFLLVAPSLREAVINDAFVNVLEAMLRRQGMVAHILYPAGDGSGSAHDQTAITRLKALAGRHKNLTVDEVRGNPAPTLVHDGVWINTNFSWLSYRGDPTRTYKREEGTLVRIKEVVDDAYLSGVALLSGA